MSDFLAIPRNKKFVYKYLSLAKYFGEMNNPCHSRKIGVVITDNQFNKILATGYNGPPRGISHCDTPEHLNSIFIPQLNENDKKKIALKMNCDCFDHEKFISKYAYEKICPRKILDCNSGERLNLCTCVHAEVNAVINAACDLNGSYMFAWCPLPCLECTKVIINAGIKKVFCFAEEKDYSHGSRYLFNAVMIDIHELEKNEFNHTQI